MPGPPKFPPGSPERKTTPNELCPPGPGAALPHSPALAPVCDLVLVPLELSEEVVVGPLEVATAWPKHGLNGALVQFTCLG